VQNYILYSFEDFPIISLKVFNKLIYSVPYDRNKRPTAMGNALILKRTLYRWLNPPRISPTTRILLEACIQTIRKLSSTAIGSSI